MKNSLSLQIMLFGLFFPSLAKAQAGVTLLVKTATSCKWNLDGQPMGLLNADDARVVLVSPGEHLIEAAATIGASTVRTSVQVGQVEKTVDLQFKGRIGQPADTQRAEKPRTGADADAAMKTIWTDPSTGLMWTKEDNGSDVDWLEATAYCSKLQLAGYDHWRLPTNEELLSIRDLSVNVRKRFDNGVTYDVHVKGNLDLTGKTWSSSQGEHLGNGAQTAWLFTFAGPHDNSALKGPFLNFIHFRYDTRALCVHLGENAGVDR